MTLKGSSAAVESAVERRVREQEESVNTYLVKRMKKRVDRAIHQEFYNIMNVYYHTLANSNISHLAIVNGLKAKRDKYKLKIESSEVWTPQAKYEAYRLAVDVLETKNK